MEWQSQTPHLGADILPTPPPQLTTHGFQLALQRPTEACESTCPASRVCLPIPLPCLPQEALLLSVPPSFLLPFLLSWKGEKAQRGAPPFCVIVSLDLRDPRHPPLRLPLPCPEHKDSGRPNDLLKVTGKFAIELVREPKPPDPPSPGLFLINQAFWLSDDPAGNV